MRDQEPLNKKPTYASGTAVKLLLKRPRDPAKPHPMAATRGGRGRGSQVSRGRAAQTTQVVQKPVRHSGVGRPVSEKAQWPWIDLKKG